MEEISVKAQHQWITSITLVFNCQSCTYMQCFSQSFVAREKCVNTSRSDYLIVRGGSARFFKRKDTKNAKPKQSWKKDCSCRSNETRFHMNDFHFGSFWQWGILKLGNEGLKILLIILAFILSSGWRPSSSCCVFMMKQSRNTNSFWRCSRIMFQLWKVCFYA